jgi:hypothetical protein
MWSADQQQVLRTLGVPRFVLRTPPASIPLHSVPEAPALPLTASKMPLTSSDAAVTVWIVGTPPTYLAGVLQTLSIALRTAAAVETLAVTSGADWVHLATERAPPYCLLCFDAALYLAGQSSARAEPDSALAAAMLRPTATLPSGADAASKQRAWAALQALLRELDATDQPRR